MKCVHCENPIRGATYVYAESKAAAHVECVSQPSAAEMDRLLVLVRQQERKNTRRVWTSRPR